MLHTDDSLNGSVNGHSDKPPKPPVPPRSIPPGTGSVPSGADNVTLTRPQFEPSLDAADPADRLSGPGSSTGTRERKFDTEHGPVTCPALIGEYEVIDLIGRGGMGNVFKVKNPFLGKEEALKMLDARLKSGTDRDRFIAEMRAQAGLVHTNIARINYAGVCRAAGQHHDQLYFVMPLEKGDLGEAIKAHGAYPPDEAANIVRRLAKAIGLAHAGGRVHCDLKPKNILLGGEDGKTPLVTDFGLVKLLAETQAAGTGQGRPFGTPSYMPPEQAEGDLNGVDERSDVYGLGGILYELLTARPPYQGKTREDILVQVKSERVLPEPIRSIRPAVPARLEAICMKCLAKKPAGRYASAAELERELDLFARPRWWRRHWKPAAVAAGFLGLLTVAVGFWFQLYMPPRTKARESAAAGRNEALPFGTRETAFADAQKEFDKILAGDIVLWRDALTAERTAAEAGAAAAKAGQWIEELEDARRQAEKDRGGWKTDKAVSDLRGVAEKFKAKPVVGPVERNARATVLTLLADLQLDRREYKEAEANLTEAEEQLGGDAADHRLARAEVCYVRGKCQAQQEQWADALQTLRHGRDLRVAAAPPPDHPDYRAYRRRLALSHGYLGDAETRQNLIPDATASYEAAKVIRADLAATGDVDDLCFHARDDSNLADLCEWQGGPKVDDACRYHCQLVAYYREKLGGVPVLPGEHRWRRAEVTVQYAELLVDLPDKPGPKVTARFEEADDLLEAAHAEVDRLTKDADGKYDPALVALQARLALADARRAVAWSRATYRPAVAAEATAPLAAAVAAYEKLDQDKKARTDDYYNWAAALALQAQLSPDAERSDRFVLALDRLEKAMRMGFVKTERLKRDHAFAAIRHDKAREVRLNELTARCVEKCAAGQPAAKMPATPGGK